MGGTQITLRQAKAWVSRFHSQNGRWPASGDRIRNGNRHGQRIENWARRTLGCKSLHDFCVKHCYKAHTKRPVLPSEVKPKASKAALAKLPAVERQVYDLYFIQKVTQREIAEGLGITQAAVSYRTKRLKERLAFLRKYPEYLSFSEMFFRRDLAHVEAKDLDILVTFWRTTSQSETAEVLGLTQGCVRHRIDLMVNALQKEGSPYYRLFHGLFGHCNILREVAIHEHQKTPPGLRRRKELLQRWKQNYGDRSSS